MTKTISKEIKPGRDSITLTVTPNRVSFKYSEWHTQIMHPSLDSFLEKVSELDVDATYRGMVNVMPLGFHAKIMSSKFVITMNYYSEYGVLLAHKREKKKDS